MKVVDDSAAKPRNEFLLTIPIGAVFTGEVNEYIGTFVRADGAVVQMENPGNAWWGETLRGMICNNYRRVSAELHIKPI